jgi:hypothetical protein
MQDFADMAEAHEWTLRRLREMAGRLTEQAYLRASAAVGTDDEAHARWMLVFDRMARGLRLSIALEARLFRERRWDADEIRREASGAQHAPRWRRAVASDAAASGVGASGAWATGAWAEPSESDAERDDDGLPQDAPLAERIGRLTAIIEGADVADTRVRGAEAEALDLERAERAGRPATPAPPDAPFDIPALLDRAELLPWRGSG